MSAGYIRAIRAAFVSVVMILLLYARNSETSNTLKAAFLNVGQGDSIFITTPQGARLLIDGGKDETVLRRLSEHMPLFDKRIDVVIATHPDADHVGGLTSVVERYTIGRLYYSPMNHETPDAVLFERALESLKIPAHALRAGDIIALDADVMLHILYPVEVKPDGDTNDSSVVARLVYKDTSIVLTGDASQGIEYALASWYGEKLKSSLLKLGHHGSNTSTSDVFLGFVKPEYAIISRGCKNTYGHPHAEVLNRLTQFNIPHVDTCTDGSVTFESDGVAFTRR